LGVWFGGGGALLGVGAGFGGARFAGAGCGFAGRRSFFFALTVDQPASIVVYSFRLVPSGAALI
jgi:hypothetical protein